MLNKLTFQKAKKNLQEDDITHCQNKFIKNQHCNEDVTKKRRKKEDLLEINISSSHTKD